MSLLQEKCFLIDGPSGDLEVKVNQPAEPSAAVGCAVIAHPHPQHGGTFDNKVVQTLARSALLSGYLTLRFNFRGVGQSIGDYDGGVGEIKDMLCAVDYARSIQPEGRLALAGFSFGAFIAAESSKKIGSVDKLTLVAPAVGRFKVGAVSSDALVLHGANDDLVTLAEVLQWAEDFKLPITVFPNTGHFFHGMLAPLKNVVRSYLQVPV